ncbi:MAG TPA: hypothetical protein VGQ09_16895 [Chitinophagaceae bacterium]|jgi:hypothetical protein|nr:hypothetical protein [Chitinophagaceae bacterium]
MKKIISAVTVSLCCLLHTTVLNAQTSTVPAVVKESFNNHFKNSQFSRFVQLGDIYVFVFSQGEEYRDAYFTKDGEFKGVGRYIPASMLPIMVREKIEGSYYDYKLSELYQYDCTENGLCFCAILKNDKYKLILRMTPAGEVIADQKTRIKADNHNSYSAIVSDLTRKSVVSK